MLKYVGLDWRKSQSHNCNQKLNPGPQFMYDGIFLNPLETMFIKVKSLHSKAKWGNVVHALKYSEWKQSSDSSKNEFFDLKKSLISKAEATVHRECFDFDTYKTANYDLKSLNWTNERLFSHYLSNGQFEARPGVKLKC